MNGRPLPLSIRYASDLALTVDEEPSPAPVRVTYGADHKGGRTPIAIAGLAPAERAPEHPAALRRESRRLSQGAAAHGRDRDEAQAGDKTVDHEDISVIIVRDPERSPLIRQRRGRGRDASQASSSSDAPHVEISRFPQVYLVPTRGESLCNSVTIGCAQGAKDLVIVGASGLISRVFSSCIGAGAVSEPVGCLISCGVLAVGAYPSIRAANQLLDLAGVQDRRLAFLPIALACLTPWALRLGGCVSTSGAVLLLARNAERCLRYLGRDTLNQLLAGAMPRGQVIDRDGVAVSGREAIGIDAYRSATASAFYSIFFAGMFLHGGGAQGMQDRFDRQNGWDDKSDAQSTNFGRRLRATLGTQLGAAFAEAFDAFQGQLWVEATLAMRKKGERVVYVKGDGWAAIRKNLAHLLETAQRVAGHAGMRFNLGYLSAGFPENISAATDGDWRAMFEAIGPLLSSVTEFRGHLLTRWSALSSHQRAPADDSKTTGVWGQSGSHVEIVSRAAGAVEPQPPGRPPLGSRVRVAGIGCTVVTTATDRTNGEERVALPRETAAKMLAMLSPSCFRMDNWSDADVEVAFPRDVFDKLRAGDLHKSATFTLHGPSGTPIDCRIKGIHMADVKAEPKVIVAAGDALDVGESLSVRIMDRPLAADGKHARDEAASPRQHVYALRIADLDGVAMSERGVADDPSPHSAFIPGSTFFLQGQPYVVEDVRAGGSSPASIFVVGAPHPRLAQLAHYSSLRGPGLVGYAFTRRKFDELRIHHFAAPRVDRPYEAGQSIGNREARGQDLRILSFHTVSDEWGSRDVIMVGSPRPSARLAQHSDGPMERWGGGYAYPIREDEFEYLSSPRWLEPAGQTPFTLARGASYGLRGVTYRIKRLFQQGAHGHEMAHIATSMPVARLRQVAEDCIEEPGKPAEYELRVDRLQALHRTGLCEGVVLQTRSGTWEVDRVDGERIHLARVRSRSHSQMPRQESESAHLLASPSDDSSSSPIATLDLRWCFDNGYCEVSAAGRFADPQPVHDAKHEQPGMAGGPMPVVRNALGTLSAGVAYALRKRPHVVVMVDRVAREGALVWSPERLVVRNARAMTVLTMGRTSGFQYFIDHARLRTLVDPEPVLHIAPESPSKERGSLSPARRLSAR